MFETQDEFRNLERFSRASGESGPGTLLGEVGIPPRLGQDSSPQGLGEFGSHPVEKLGSPPSQKSILDLTSFTCSTS
jgi:hypothetical protein